MEVKLKSFFAIDIKNSTELKTKHDYERILYQLDIKEMEEILKKLRSGETDQTLIGTILNKNINERIEKIFTDTPKVFKDFLQELKYYEEEYSQPPKLFKELGDSIIFECEINQPKQLHTLVTAFSRTVLEINQLSKNQYDMELKGMVWCAEFPIKNQVRISIDEHGNKKEDYTGIDIDKGFRLGNYTVPGILTMSMDIVHILMGSKIPDNESICIHFWKYEILKGMWNRKKYPIILAVAGKEYLNHEAKIEIPYDEDINFKPISSHKGNIEKILKQVNKEYDKPYIICDQTERAIKDELLKKHELREKIKKTMEEDGVPSNQEITKDEKNTIEPDERSKSATTYILDQL